MFSFGRNFGIKRAELKQIVTLSQTLDTLNKYFVMGRSPHLDVKPFKNIFLCPGVCFYKVQVSNRFVTTF